MPTLWPACGGAWQPWAPSDVAGLSRSKGKGGERELAALLSTLTGHDVRRRVRQHAGDDDLEGVPGWSVEAKRYRAVTPALIATWWQQALRQAQATGCRPVLFYRADRGQWRAVWPAHLVQQAGHRLDLADEDTLEASPSVWWALSRAPHQHTSASTTAGHGSRPTAMDEAGPAMGPSARTCSTGNSNPVNAVVHTPGKW